MVKNVQIGSIVRDGYDRIKKIGEGSLYLIHTDKDFAKNHYPIPLDDKLLKKIGFIFNEDIFFKELDYSQVLAVKDRVQYYEAGAYVRNEFYPLSGPIKYLHEIQNILSALSGFVVDIEKVRELFAFDD